jgi:signal transduction histidine kinase
VIVTSGHSTHDDLFIYLFLIFTTFTSWVFRRVVRRDRRHTAHLERANRSLGGLLEQLDRSRDEERHRIAGEIHDFSLQGLLAAQMHTRQAKRSPNTSTAHAAVEAADDLLGTSIKSLRSALKGIDPIPLYNADLSAAISSLAASIEAAYNTSVVVTIQDGLELPTQQQILVYRIIAEAVTNAAKHGAPRRIVVVAASHGGEVSLLIEDDGRGFAGEIPYLSSAGPVPADGSGLGLRLMTEQVRMMDGWISIDSAPKRGTTVQIRLPHTRE